MSEKRLLESIYRESPADSPSIGWEVIAPVVLYTGAAYVAFAAVYDTVLPELVAAVVCALSLTWRLYRWDSNGRPVSVAEHKWYAEDPDPPPERIMVPSDGHTRRRRLKIGRWSFTRSEWQRLATALGQGHVTREALEDLERDNGERMFPNPTGRYNEYVEELQRIGWVDQDKVVLDKTWTDLAEMGIAPPSQSE